LMAILPHTTADGAQAGARRILAAAHRLSFQPQGSPLRVTLSIGISHYEDDNTLFFDSLVEAAEAALAEATKSGGDRFVHRVPGPREARTSR